MSGFGEAVCMLANGHNMHESLKADTPATTGLATPFVQQQHDGRRLLPLRQNNVVHPSPR